MSGGVPIDETRCREYRQQTQKLLSVTESKFEDVLKLSNKLVQKSLENLIGLVEAIEKHLISTEDIRVIIEKELADHEKVCVTEARVKELIKTDGGVKDLSKGFLSIPAVVTLVVYVVIIMGTWFAASSERSSLKRDNEELEKRVIKLEEDHNGHRHNRGPVTEGASK